MIEIGTFRSRSKVCRQERQTPVWSREDAKTLLDSIPKDSVSGLRGLALIRTGEERQGAIAVADPDL
jgi:hypothetical protein